MSSTQVYQLTHPTNAFGMYLTCMREVSNKDKCRCLSTIGVGNYKDRMTGLDGDGCTFKLTTPENSVDLNIKGEFMTRTHTFSNGVTVIENSDGKSKSMQKNTQCHSQYHATTQSTMTNHKD